MTNCMQLAFVTAVIVTNFAGCTSSDRKASAIAPPISDDMLVARLALMEHIHRYENLPSLTGLPRIIFVGRRKGDQDKLEVEDVAVGVLNGLHSPTFTIEPVSNVKFEPIAKEPMYYVTHRVSGERGIRILIDELECEQQSATVATSAVMSSCDWDRPNFHVFLSRNDGKWRVISTETTRLVP